MPRPAGRTSSSSPAGEAVFAFDQMARAGQVPGFAGASDLYRDDNGPDAANIHFNPNGQYLAALTYYATITGESPIGLPAQGGVSPETAGILQQIAFNAVNGSPLSGVPEPTTLALLPAAGITLLRRRRRGLAG